MAPTKKRTPNAAPIGSPSGSNGGDKKRGPPPIKPSPFKKTKVAVQKKKKGPPTVTIYHVLPTTNLEGTECGHEGYSVHIEGFTGKQIVECLYKKNNNDNAAMFFEFTVPVPRAIEFVKGDTPVTVEGMNGKTYPVKILVHRLMEDEPQTEESLTNYVKDTFIPALMAQDVFREDAYTPVMHPTQPYIRCQSWNELVGNDGGLYDLYVYGFKNGLQVPLSAWFKADKMNLYSFFPIGGIPNAVKDKYALTQEHMFPADHVAIPQPAEEASDEDEGDDEEDKKQPGKAAGDEGDSEQPSA